MAKILVLYYSSWGHMEQMAKAAAEGAREAGATVTIKRAKELVPEEVAKAAYYKLDQEAPIADPLELGDYDGIILGVSTRFGTDDLAAEEFPRPDRSAVGEGRAGQQGGDRDVVDLDPAWRRRAGDPDHASLAAASRHDHRAAVLCLSRASWATTWCAAARLTA